MADDQYFRSRRFMDILRMYTDAERNGVPCIISVEDYSDLAEYFCNRGEIDRGRFVADRACKLYPDSYQPYILKARLALLYDHDTKEAMRHLEEVVDKTELEYIYTLAEIYIAEGNITKANRLLRDNYKNQLDEDKDSYCLDVAELFIDDGMAKEAKTWLKRCKDCECSDYKELNARLLMMQGEYKESEMLFDELLDEDPYSIKHWNAMASSQFMDGNIQESMESSDYALAIDPYDKEALLNKANCLTVLNNHEEALKCYDRYCEHYPEEARGHICRGICMITLQRWDEAKACYEEAEKKDLSDDAQREMLYLQMMHLMKICGDVDKALECLEKLDRLHPYIPGMKDVKRGDIYLANDMPKEAQACFSKACETPDASGFVMLEMAISFYENMYTEMAYYLFKELRECTDDMVADSVYAYLAACCHALRKKREFVSYVKKAVLADPDEAWQILHHLFPDDMDAEDYPSYAKQAYDEHVAE